MIKLPALVQVRPGRYLTIAGKGPPGGVQFQQKLGALPSWKVCGGATTQRIRYVMGQGITGRSGPEFFFLTLESTPDCILEMTGRDEPLPQDR